MKQTKFNKATDADFDRLFGNILSTEVVKKPSKNPKWMPELHYNGKHSKSLMNELLTFPIFEDNPKKIAQVSSLLWMVNSIVSKSDKDFTGNISCITLKDNGDIDAIVNSKRSKSLKFQFLKNKVFNIYPLSPSPMCPRSGQNKQNEEIYVRSIELSKAIRKEYFSHDFVEITNILEEIGIFVIDHSFNIEGTNKYCKSFHLTEKGKNFANDSIRDYLPLMLEKDTYRKIQKSNSKNGYTKLKHDDINMQNVKEIIDSIKPSEFKKMVNVILEMEDDGKFESNSYTLFQIISKIYNMTEDGRSYNPLSRLSSEVTASIAIKGKPYRGTTDVRSMVPTCFGLFCRDVKDRTLDQLAFEGTNFDEDKFKKEIDRWNDIWTSDYHPRDYIKSEVNYEFKNDQEVKDMLNKAFNGGKGNAIKTFLKWLKDNFPNMYNVWQCYCVSETGLEIARTFESRIFRSGILLKEATRTNCIIIDRHDGVQIFGAQRNTEKLIKFIEEHAKEVTGIDIKFGSEF